LFWARFLVRGLIAKGPKHGALAQIALFSNVSSQYKHLMSEVLYKCVQLELLVFNSVFAADHHCLYVVVLVDEFQDP